MDLHQLNIIHQAARCKCNLTTVAQALHTSQPGVSRHIRALEDELGVELFIRVGKRLVGMTESGREVLDIASRIMVDVGNLKGISKRFGQSGAGMLRVAATSGGADKLPGLAARLRSRHPGVRITLRQQSSQDVLPALLQDDADIGVAGELLRGARGVVTFPCALLPYQALVPLAHPLSSLPRKKLSLEALAGYPLMSYPAGMEERVHVDNAFAAAGFSPEIVITADAAMLAACARLGLGVALVCGWDAQSRASKDLRALDASHLFRANGLVAAFRRGKILRDFESDYARLLLPDLDTDTLQNALLAREEASCAPNYAI